MQHFLLTLALTAASASLVGLPSGQESPAPAVGAAGEPSDTAQHGKAKTPS